MSIHKCGVFGHSIKINKTVRDKLATLLATEADPTIRDAAFVNALLLFAHNPVHIRVRLEPDSRVNHKCFLTLLIDRQDVNLPH